MSIDEVELLRAACCVAGLDGQVTEEEEQLLRDLKEHAGVGEASFQAMLDRARNDPDYYEDVLDVVRPNAEQVLQLLARVAAADGEVSTTEREMIHTFAERLGIEKDHVKQVLTAADSNH